MTMSMFPWRAHIWISAVAMGLLPAVSVQAQNPSGAGEAEAMFQSLDTNKDGKLTKDEARPNAGALYDQIFQMAGKKAGESISRAEFQQVFDRHRAGNASRPSPNNPPGNSPGAPPEPSGRPAESAHELPPVLRDFDANRDGKLSRAELSRINQRFEQFDTNRDGGLDAAEIRNAAEASRTEAPAAESSRRSGTTTSSGPPAGTGLTGVWRGWVVRGTGEDPNSGEMQVELTIQGNQIRAQEIGTNRAPDGLGAGTYTMTGNGRTGTLDADGTTGPQEGRHFMGIYELDGNTLRWCVSNRGRQRPETMATDRGNYLMILRRQ